MDKLLSISTPTKSEAVFQYSYDLGDGKRITSLEASQLSNRINPSSSKEDLDLFEALKRARKERTTILGYVEPPGPVVTFTKKGITTADVVEALNRFHIKTLENPCQIPMNQGFLKIDSLKSTDLLDWTDSLKLMDIEFKVTETKIQGRKQTYVFKGETQSLYTLKIFAPGFDFVSSSKMAIPTYYFTFSTLPYVKPWLTDFYKRLVGGKFMLNPETTIAKYNAMNLFAREHYFGNGSLSGMLSRAADMVAQRKMLGNPPTITLDRISSLLLRALPGEILDFYHFSTLNLKSYINKTYICSGKPRTAYSLNAKANPGPLYSKVMNKEGVKVNKADTMLSDFVLAQQMMVYLEQDLVEDKNEHAVFWEHYRSIRLFNLFPKSEVYVKKELLTKTRMIASYGAMPMVPATFFLQPFMDMLTFKFSELPMLAPGPASFKGNLIASRLSLSGGNCRLLMDTLEKANRWNPGSRTAFVFADNIYFLEKLPEGLFWYSLDLKKAEASITPKFIGVVNQYIALLYTTRFKTQISETWYKYMTEIYPYVAAEGIALIANQQFVYPAMGSGTQGTFLYNSMKSALIVTEALEKGIPFVTEGQISKELTQLAAKHNAVLTNEASFKYEPKMDYYKTDLIGFDLKRFLIDEHQGFPSYEYFPVLPDERLFPSVLYRKEHYSPDGQSKLGERETAIYDLVRIRSLFLNGAWSDIDLTRLLMYEANKLVRELRGGAEKGSPELLLAIYEEYKEDEGLIFDDDTFAHFLVKPTAPTIFELVSILSGSKETADRACVFRIGTMPISWIYPPENLQGDYYEQWVEEVAMDPIVLSKMYPSIAVGFLPSGNKAPVVGDVKKAGIKFHKPNEVKKELAVKDVATPKGLKPAIKVQTPEREKGSVIVVQWLSKLKARGVLTYRVPHRNRYRGKIQDLENPDNSALHEAARILSGNTSFSREDTYKILKMTDIVFTFGVLERRPYMDVFDYSDKFLAEGYIVNRRFEPP